MTGAYLVELDPIEDNDTDLLGAEATPSQAAAAAAAGGPDLGAALPGSAAPQSLRYYFVLDSLQHPAVKAMPCSKFFYHCWQQGFHFDVDHRQVRVAWRAVARAWGGRGGEDERRMGGRAAAAYLGCRRSVR